MQLEIGSDYARFRRSLAPRYGKVWSDIALGYGWLALVLFAVGSVSGIATGLAAAVPGAIGIGYGIAYLQLFIHEAAHGNLAADRKTNDRIADWLIAWQVGSSISDYRRTHSEHHRLLGEPGDTEVSYRTRLTLRFILEMVTGIHALRVFLTRRKTAADRQSGGASRGGTAPLLLGAGVHVALLGALLATGAWPAALAWVVGIGSVYPLFATLRQLLEHRPMGHEGQAGAVTRMFGDDFFSRTFGGAGFNRHFLHHLEPQISYSRLAEFEVYLSGTAIAPLLDGRRSSYFTVFRNLLRDR